MLGNPRSRRECIDIAWDRLILFKDFLALRALVTTSQKHVLLAHLIRISRVCMLRVVSLLYFGFKIKKSVFSTWRDFCLGCVLVPVDSMRVHMHVSFS